MVKSIRFWVLILVVAVVVVAVQWWFKPFGGGHQAVASPAQAVQSDNGLQGRFDQILVNYRKIIVLLAFEEKLSDSEKAAANQAGQALFHENLAMIEAASADMDQLAVSQDEHRYAVFEGLLDYVESARGLFDADRLAFRELLASMQNSIVKDGSLPAIKLHKRIGEDMEALNEIERMYEKELNQIFGRFEQRAIQLKRERWADYVAHLRKMYARDQILKEYGQIVPYTAPKAGSLDEAENKKEEIGGYELPPKTVALTFDDGPHPVYTAEIEAILKQYGVPAVFFNVGRNLGAISADGKAEVSTRGEISRKLMQDGFVIANHSFSHAQLSKEKGDSLRAEIVNTDTLLKAVDAKRSALFRFPYGASNKEANKYLNEAKLKSVMWNIDSLDWADPVPKSIVDRVMQTVHKEERGIILFHDIHERTVKALPAVLDQLVAEGYQFAGWDGNFFRVSKEAQEATGRKQISTGYGNSWAVVIGIDAYAKWPKLQYAANDAQAIRQELVDRFGFPGDHVFALVNEQATRNGILGVFHDRLANDGIKKDDRIFVFFAGHGATRKLSSGRDLGYIIPVDSDPNRFEADAIPMTEIQNIAESLEAKHVLFVMDACYSGLGLARGATASAYLRDNAKRVGRQMLTAGGADQMVSDGGPNGHSIFTWTLLQGLEGKGDLNGDGLITATELAAYVAPAVAGVSHQTPAFGSLPGSQGGEFVLELAGENEFINEQTAQLTPEAIALNTRLDSAAPAAPVHDTEKASVSAAPVVLKDLQGSERKVALPAPAMISVKQMAQLANDRGLKFYREKKYAESEAEFTEALKLRPNFALAANNLGFVFFKQGRFKEAALWFENTIKMDPSRAIAYVNLGDSCMQNSLPAQAKQAYETYLQLAPKGSNAPYVKQQLDKL